MHATFLPSVVATNSHKTMEEMVLASTRMDNMNGTEVSVVERHTVVGTDSQLVAFKMQTFWT